MEQIKLLKSSKRTIFVNGKKISVITKSRDPKPQGSEAPIYQEQPPQHRSTTRWDDKPSKGITAVETDYDAFSQSLANQIAEFERSNRANKRRKRYG